MIDEKIEIDKMLGVVMSKFRQQVFFIHFNCMFLMNDARCRKIGCTMPFFLLPIYIYMCVRLLFSLQYCLLSILLLYDHCKYYWFQSYVVG